MDPTQEWLTHPAEDLARRVDIVLAHGPSTGAILDAFAAWISDVEITHAAVLDVYSSQTRMVTWIRTEVHRASQVRNRTSSSRVRPAAT